MGHFTLINLSLIAFALILRCGASEDRAPRRECFGTHNGYSFSMDGSFSTGHSNRYRGCTHVMGNLEISWNNNVAYEQLLVYQHIRYVSGYVMIVGNRNMPSIPLLSLEIIRGNDTLGAGDNQCGLMVALNDDLEVLQMPKLKEISRGSVLFHRNPKLGYVNTIDWSLIVTGYSSRVIFRSNAFDVTVSRRVGDICNGGGMWGNDPSLCQETVQTPGCHDLCNGRCFGPSAEECCNENCAVGCSGPTNRDCRGCKDFEDNGRCLPYCPLAWEYNAMMCTHGHPTVHVVT